MAVAFANARGRLSSALPHGKQLPVEEWQRRHRMLLAALWLQIPALTLFGLAEGYNGVHLAAHVAPIALFGVLANVKSSSRSLRASCVSLGLLTGAAVAVHSSHGVIEAHFYFFVVIVALTLYEDWVPFLLAVAFVGLHHGVFGAIDRSAVYNHPGNVWWWAAIHAAFVAAAGAAALVAWRLNEDVRARTRRAEDALRRSEERYRHMVNLASEGVWTIDAQNRTTFANPRMAELLGYAAGELSGKAPFEFMDPEGSAAARQLLGASGQCAEKQVEVQLSRSDGETVWALLSANVISKRDGAYDGALLLVTDVTERKRAQEESDRLKQEFFALVSHELRTPLTSIIGYTELAEEGETLKEVSGSIEVIHRNAKRLDSLVADLLLLAQVEAGTFSVQIERADLERITRDSVEAAAPNAVEKGVRLEIKVEEVPVFGGDANRLAQVLDNLISNAVKFTPRNGSVEVRLLRRNGNARLEVEDTGVGIPRAEQARLFERFFRASSAFDVQGVGLGLAITQVIVNAHEGDIGLESVEGKGTTFHVELPLRTVPDEQAAAALTAAAT